MSSDDMIRFQGVAKRYSRYGGILGVKNLIDRLKNGQVGKRLVREPDFWALRDVSFTIRRGERLGLIGPNGAGKSTLMKLALGVAYPTQGTVTINGRVGGLLELGAGFQPELSGRENVYLMAAFQGLGRRSVDALFDRIVDIAGVHEFIDVPLKRYSSGMKVRLGFAVAMATTPDVILLDEVLAVGDAKFREKSMGMVEQYIDGRTLIFVSHNMAEIARLCDRVLVLGQGRIVFAGPPDEAIAFHLENMTSSTDAPAAAPLILQPGISRGFAESPLVWIERLEIDQGCVPVRRGEPLNARILLQSRGCSSRLGNMAMRLRVKRAYELVAGREVILPLEATGGATRVSLATDVLLPGTYVLESSVRLEHQSATTAVSVSRLEFQVAEDADAPSTLVGIVDLDLRVTPESTDRRPRESAPGFQDPIERDQRSP